MRAWKHHPISVLFLVAIAFALTAYGQERPASPGRTDSADDADGAQPDLSRLHPFQRVVYLSARRGVEWLWNANRPDGLFVSGHIPALRSELESDSFLHQASGAAALARGARFTGSSRYAVRARQALLTLLASTKIDPTDAGVRFTVLPESEVNRLASASMLIVGISELPEPGADLLEQLDQLSQFIVRQQQADGSFRTEAAREPMTKTDVEACSALALYGLLRGHAVRPSGSKLAAAKAGLAFHQACWTKAKRAELAPWLTCAAVDLHAAAKDKQYADVAFALADWQCALQFAAEPRHPLWQGGFARWENGSPATRPPGIESAQHAQALAHACRVARQTGDVQRFERYRESTERCLQFVTTLQYTSANTRHFADWYRPTLYGAFFASPQDGNIRVDYAQHAIGAMTDYLEFVAQAKLGTGK